MENKTVTSDVLSEELDILCGKYGQIMTVSTIGKSLVGRDIPLIRIGKGEKSVLYVGTHHAMEWITTLFLLKYTEEYCEAITSGKRLFGIDTEFLYGVRSVYIVPMLNPDGVELQVRGRDALNPLTDRLNSMSGGYFSRWQANGRGVDLNHNYDAGFADYKPIEASLGIFGGAPTRFSGEYPESEPETSALCSFIRANPISLLIALHTQGGEIYYDFNGHVPPRSASIAKQISSLCGYRLAVPEPAASFGGLKDWFIDKFDRPGFTIECGKGTNPLPLSDTDIIYRGILPVLFKCPLMI